MNGKYFVAAALILTSATGITFSKEHVYAKAKQQQPIQTVWKDGSPKPVCPPPPMPCQ